MLSVALTRRNLTFALVVLSVAALVVELVLILPRALEWHPWDYGNYVRMGMDLRQGLNPYGPDRYYPLPTMMWIFVPLSLLPDWFRLVWIFAPVVFVLKLFRIQAVWFALFPPLWFVMTDAMFDGWLLIPLVWVLANRPILGGLGAALLLFKPHAVVLTVAYMLVWWLVSRDWNNLAAFAGAMIVLWLPSFFLDPTWPFKMLSILQTRADQISVLPLLTASIWSWWWLDGFAKLIFFGLLAVVGVLFWRAIQSAPNRAAAFQLLGLLLNPVMLASNLITVLPTVRGQVQVVSIVLVSMGAYALDRVMNGFGGGYALIPLFALYFQTYPALSDKTAARE